MSVARLRALTRAVDAVVILEPQSRNECGPFEGIDTCSDILFYPPFACRNECGPFEGIDTEL